jgi:hypothetical protein
VPAGGKDKRKSQENAHHIRTQIVHNARCFFPWLQVVKQVLTLTRASFDKFYLVNDT